MNVFPVVQTSDQAPPRLVAFFVDEDDAGAFVDILSRMFDYELLGNRYEVWSEDEIDTTETVW